MEKKEYRQPSINVYLVYPMKLLADSGDTGATGCDVPWGADCRNSLNRNWDEEELEF